MAETSPNVFTVATAEFVDDHVTILLVALEGKIFDTNDFVKPILIEHDDGEIETDDTNIVIVMAHVAVIPSHVAVMIADPADTAVTTPDEFTVALEEFELHVTVLFVALDGTMVVVNDNVLVGRSVADV